MTTALAHIAAEQAVVGSLLLAPKWIPAVERMLTSADFEQPRHEVLYATIVALHEGGKPVDPTSVLASLDSAGLRTTGGGSYIHTLIAQLATAANVEYHADLVKAASRRRQAMKVAERITQAVREVQDGDDLADVLAREALALDLLIDEKNRNDPIEGLSTWDEFIRLHGGAVRKWVVPGAISAKDVWLILAPAGAGKTTLSRQVAWCIAAGINPFTLSRIEPKRTLLVDLENDEGEAADESSSFLAAVKRIGDWDVDRAHVWSWTEGLNLRKHADAQKLERVVAETRPAIVCLGSLYKTYQRGNSDWDTVAGEVRDVFDRIRRRYHCALWLEHHMPKAADGGQKGTPFGSSIWEWWPSHGRILRRAVDSPGSPFTFANPFRGDRGKREAPVGFTRGGRLPWSAVMEPAELEILIDAVGGSR